MNRKYGSNFSDDNNNNNYLLTFQVSVDDWRDDLHKM